MKDGYYISAYVHIDALAHIYQISLRHDQTIALWYKEKKKVRLIRYWELERKSGLKKHDLSFYSREQCLSVIQFLLGEVNLKLEDIEAIWGTPGLEMSGDVSSYTKETECPLHTLCHLFSGIMIDTKMFYNDKILALALDGGPDNVVDRYAREKDFYWGVYCICGKMEYFSVPSPGAFWSLLKIKCGMEEGSLMALGSATSSKLNDEQTILAKMPEVYNGEDFNLAYTWIEELVEKVQSISIKDVLDYDKRFSEQENRISMAVKVVQSASIVLLNNVIQRCINKYNIEPAETNLTMTGGFSLNCPSNSFIMQKFGFKSFSTCPCVNDSGIALGMGLYEFYSRMKVFDFELKNAYYGSKERRTISATSDKWKKHIKLIDTFSYEQFVLDLENEPLIWFNGQAEIGPRALGARSILGNPADKKTCKILNQIKCRQWWRPVAPIILSEEKENWFQETFESPYMLCTSYVIPEKRDSLCSALHLDDSARIQSLEREKNSVLYDGIKLFFQKNKIPVICNTSLNDKGEPIIDSYDECINFALRKKIKVVYLDNYRIILQKHKLYKRTEPYERNTKMFLMQEDKEQIRQKLNPGGLTKEQVDLYLNIPELSRFDIKDENDLKQLMRILRQWRRLNSTIWTAMLL